MNLRIVLAAIILSAGVVSCGGNSPPNQNRAAGMQAANSQENPPARDASRNADKASAPATAENIPPADAQFTLFVDSIQGPAHVLKALELKKQLIAQTHRQGWYVISSESQSSLYFGYYRTIDDAQREPKEVRRAQSDRRMVENMLEPAGGRRFPKSIFVSVNSPDPQAPPEWNLANAPADAFWSVQIGAYQGSPERKQYAVDAVRELRQNGKQAYFYHGDTISSVCIGLWPRAAVKEQGARDDAHTVDPTQPLMVFADVLPPNMPTEIYRDGRKVQVEAPKVEILDPTLKATFKEFPVHAVNGEVRGRAEGTGIIPDPSYLVQVPRRPGSSANPAEPARGAPADAAADAILDQQPAQTPGLGKLRSIGDR